jgi:membrane peptidoglycan carboxypeptidase
LAVELAQGWSKRRVLKAYLNLVFYGHHAYGAPGRRMDVLLAARASSDPPAGGAARGVAAGALAR